MFVWRIGEGGVQPRMRGDGGTIMVPHRCGLRRGEGHVPSGAHGLGETTADERLYGGAGYPSCPTKFPRTLNHCSTCSVWLCVYVSYDDHSLLIPAAVQGSM